MMDENSFSPFPSSPAILAQLWEQMPGMHLILSKDFVIDFVSKDFVSKTLLPKETLVGRSILEALAEASNPFEPPFIEELADSLQKVMESKQAHQMSLQVYTTTDPQSGSTVECYLRASTIPLLDEQGEVSCILHQLEDRTETVLAQKAVVEKTNNEQHLLALLESNYGHLRDLFEQAPVAFTILRGEQYIVELANHAVLEIWARQSTEVLGKPLFTAMPEISHQGLEELLQSVRKTGMAYVGKELPIEIFRHGKLEKVYFNFVYHPLKDRKGVVNRIAVIASDVTKGALSRQSLEATAHQLEALNEELEGRVAQRTLELKEALAEAQAQKNHLHELFMQAPLAIGIYRGGEHTIELVNPMMTGILGRHREQLLGKALFDALPEVKGQGFEQILSAVFTSGTAYAAKEIEATLLREGKLESRYYNTLYQPLRNALGEITGIIQIASDVSPQVAARKLVEQNASYFNTLLESLPQLAWTANERGEVDYLNSGWYTYSGQSGGEAVGDGWTKVTHRDDLLLVLPAWQKAIEKGKEYEVECRYRRASDQSWRWHLTRAVPLKNQAGEITKWVGTCTDIHQVRLYREKVEESEAYFRDMSDNVPVMMWVTAPDGSCTYLNKGWYQYTGQREEEALGSGWLSIIHPEDMPLSKQTFLSAISKREPFSLLYRLKGKEGAYRWFLDKGAPTYDRAGTFKGFIGALIDVNEQKSAEERLSLSVKAGKVGIWEWDIVSDRASYSDLLQEMFGFEKGSLKENFEGAYGVYQSVIYPQDRQAVNESVAKAFANKQKEFYVEFRVQKPTGELSWIAERGEVIFQEDQPVYMNGTCIDISDIKRAEEATQRLSEELAAANEELHAANEEIQASNEELSESNQKLSRINLELERTNKDLDNFVYTASHDLKAPILNMEGLLHLLGKQLKEEIGQKAIANRVYESLYASVARFKNTIGDLTQVAKVSKDNPEDITSVDLKEVYEQVRADLEPQIGEAGGEIEINLDCPNVHFSKKNLQSILYNLLSNAIKYRSLERKLLVRISCYNNESHHVLQIEDNGLGMDMRQEEKIFALFKRLHTHVEGTGIGLYIVKKMLENGGGKIEVESKVGVGSTFRVYFKRLESN